jgi:hypothetical protein
MLGSVGFDQALFSRRARKEAAVTTTDIFDYSTIAL